jgi:hypothetical protein
MAIFLNFLMYPCGGHELCFLVWYKWHWPNQWSESCERVWCPELPHGIFPFTPWELITILTCVHLKHTVFQSIAHTFVNICVECTICLLCAVSTDATCLRGVNTLLVRWQYVATHTVCQTEIPALLGSWVTNIPSVQMLRPQKFAFLYIFIKHNTLICWSVEDQSSFFCLL